MAKTLKEALKLGVVAVVALVVGAGAVLALNRPGPDVEPDSVVVLKSLGVTCGSCAGKIEKALNGKPGVGTVAVDVDSGQVIVSYDAKVARPESLAETVTAAGFGSSILQNFSMEQYQALTGRSVSAVAQAKTGGCGGGCCPKN